MFSLTLQAAIFVVLCIVGILWWLYRRFRVRRKPAPKPASHNEGGE